MKPKFGFDYVMLMMLSAACVAVVAMLVFEDRILLWYQTRLGPFCADASMRVDDREVRQYTGAVVSKPSPQGRYGHDKPDDRLGEPVFVLVHGADVPLMLLTRQADPPAPGTQLRFCAVTDNQGYWWPQTGYKAHGWFRGPLLGAPQGPFEMVKWIEDTRS